MTSSVLYFLFRLANTSLLPLRVTDPDSYEIKKINSYQILPHRNLFFRNHNAVM